MTFYETTQKQLRSYKRESLPQLRKKQNQYAQLFFIIFFGRHLFYSLLAIINVSAAGINLQ